MAYFFDSSVRTAKEQLSGVFLRTFWGERMLMSLTDLKPNVVVPAHSHLHEQIGIVVSGETEMTVAGETRRMRKGDVFVVPGGTEHSVRAGGEACQIVEVFAPVREEYKFPD